MPHLHVKPSIVIVFYGFQCAEMSPNDLPCVNGMGAYTVIEFSSNYIVLYRKKLQQNLSNLDTTLKSNV